MYRRLIYILTFCLSLSGFQLGQANNLQLEKLQLVDSQHVQFEVSWQNSWNLAGIKPPYNHDGVWVFLKFTTDGKEWQHLDIDPDKSVHTKTSKDSLRLFLKPANDQKGVLLKSLMQGSGDVPITTIKLKLANPIQSEQYAIRVFGNEMVHVPQDSFYLGDEASNFRFKKAASGNPYFINGEGTIETGEQANQLTADSQYKPASDIPESYPNGYSAKYVMKYEISQEQYVDFLNTLSPDQQSQHVDKQPGSSAGTFAFNGGSGSRNGIVIKAPAENGYPAEFACNVQQDESFDAKDDGQARACNFLKWSDLAAYLDWAGLSPMTELTFEKICRGPKQPVKKEFAWGTNNVTDANTIKKDGTIYEKAVDELPTNHGMASHGYQGPKGPLRNGFASNDTSNRLSSGAAYYGALELSGNLWEICVVVNKAGLAFQGEHGDGELSSNGLANETNWPGQNGEGAGFRGGGWNSGIIPGFRDLAVSDRFYVFDNPNSRRNTSGGRGVRRIE